VRGNSDGSADTCKSDLYFSTNPICISAPIRFVLHHVKGEVEGSVEANSAGQTVGHLRQQPSHVLAPLKRKLKLFNYLFTSPDGRSAPITAQRGWWFFWAKARKKKKKKKKKKKIFKC
jgi:hypothetical protein